MPNSYQIAVIPGDGTGPEVIEEGRKVLQSAAAKYGFHLEMSDFDFGGDRYLRTGELLPDTAVEELRGFDAIYLGAIGHPDVKPGILEKEILLRLRFELDQYINLRPVRLYPGVETPLKNKAPGNGGKPGKACPGTMGSSRGCLRRRSAVESRVTGCGAPHRNVYFSRQHRRRENRTGKSFGGISL